MIINETPSTYKESEYKYDQHFNPFKGSTEGDSRYHCLGCGRDKFSRLYQPHKCNGQYRKHKFPAGFEKVEE